MKTIKMIVYALVLCMSFVSVAEAKGRSGSFKSGFSSQKRAAPKAAPADHRVPPPKEQVKNSAFGSFGRSDPAIDQKLAKTPQSKMSKDLNETAAQTGALKAVDARTKVNEKPSDAQSESGWFRSGNQTASTQTSGAGNTGGVHSQPAHNQSFPSQGSNQHSSGFLPALMGFMVGNSLAQHHTNTVYVQQPNQNASDLNAVNENTDHPAQDTAVVESESFAMKVLRFILWIAVISGCVWLIRKVMSFRNRNFHKSSHYSLRS